MAVNPDSLVVTDQYRAALVVLTRRIAAIVVALWAIEETDVRGTFLRWLRAAVPAVVGAQAHAVALSAGYLARFLESELDEAIPLNVGLRARLIGRAADGRPLASLFAPALSRLQAAGPDEIAAAIADGRLVVARAAVGETTLAADRALRNGMGSTSAVRGWRRVASPTACGACLAAQTGIVLDTAALLPRHPFCRCTKEPVVGARETATRPTGREMFEKLSPAEQAALFAGRGGDAKASAVRGDPAAFARLAQVTTLPNGTSALSEAPVATVSGSNRTER